MRSLIKHNEFAEIDGTFSDDGSELLVSFPTGYNKDNCIIISLMGYRSNYQWIMTDMSANIAIQGIVVLTSSAIMYGRPFKLLLKKL